MDRGTRPMNILAIDPGFQRVAFAYFVDGELARTDLIRAGGARLERLHYIGEQLERGVTSESFDRSRCAAQTSSIMSDIFHLPQPVRLPPNAPTLSARQPSPP
jgi:hypothetical protein